MFPPPNQVVAAWQWMNCYEEVIPDGKKMLRINLDETSVRTYYSPKPVAWGREQEVEQFADRETVYV